MMKNLFFLDIKNNTIISSKSSELSKSDNYHMVEINHDSKHINNTNDLLQNINRILDTYNVDKNMLDNSKNIYVNDDALCLVDNKEIVTYGNNKYGGNCLYHIVNPLFVIPTTNRFIASDLHNIYVWGNMSYTFYDVKNYLRFGKWNVITNKNNTHYVFNDKNKYFKQILDFGVKNKDSLNDLSLLNKSEEIIKYIKLYIMKKLLTNTL